MKRTIWVFLYLSIVTVVLAQEKNVVLENRPDFIISANIAGDAAVLSLGIEKLFFVKEGLTLAGKVGFGYNQEFQLFGSDSPENFFILPHHFTLNLGKRRSFFEVGIGGSWITNNRDNYYLAYPMAGYRLHPFKNPGFSFRAWVFYPFGQLSTLDAIDILIAPAGLSFGIAL